MIRLSLPAQLAYRDVAVRTVAAACKLVGRQGVLEAEPVGRLDLSTEFDAHVVSAFSEAFNNIVIHAYDRSGAGSVEIEIYPLADRIEMVLYDHGRGFDVSEIGEPDLDALPESGMGLFIIHSFVDQFTYTPGTPNVWRMVKQYADSARQPGADQRLEG